MLLLSRKRGETIYIGNDIRVTVTNVDKHSGAVQIGIDAPHHIEIHREEIYRRVLKEREELAQNCYLFEITAQKRMFSSHFTAFITQTIAATNEPSARQLFEKLNKDKVSDMEISVLWHPQTLREPSPHISPDDAAIYQHLHNRILTGEPLPFVCHINTESMEKAA